MRLIEHDTRGNFVATWECALGTKDIPESTDYYMLGYSRSKEIPDWAFKAKHPSEFLKYDYRLLYGVETGWFLARELAMKLDA